MNRGKDRDESDVFVWQPRRTSFDVHCAMPAACEPQNTTSRLVTFADADGLG